MESPIDPTAVAPNISGADQHAPGAGPGPASGHVDIVPTEVVPDHGYGSPNRRNPVKPKAKGHYPPALRKGSDINRLKGRHNAKELGRMVCEGMTFQQAADALGVTVAHIRRNVWPVTKELYGPGLDSEEERESIAHYVVDVTRRVTREAAARMASDEGGAAYGAVALKGAAQLAEWYGVADRLKAQGGDGGVLKTLEEISAAVLEVSPILAGRVEAMARAKAYLEGGKRDEPTTDPIC